MCWFERCEPHRERDEYTSVGLGVQRLTSELQAVTMILPSRFSCTLLLNVLLLGRESDYMQRLDRRRGRYKPQGKPIIFPPHLCSHCAAPTGLPMEFHTKTDSSASSESHSSLFCISEARSNHCTHTLLQIL